MDQVPLEEKKSFLHNDRLMVCGMLAFYGICLLGLVGAVIWGLNYRSQTTAAGVTATAAEVTSPAAAAPTQDAIEAATVVARKTEQAQYQVVDPFDNNEKNWWATTVNDDNMTGSVKVIGGVYLWDLQKVKQPFVDLSAFPGQKRYADFNVYVDSKIVSKQPGDACSGFVFRTSVSGWEKGAYIFSVCSDSTFSVFYYKEEWESIARREVRRVIQSSGWNRLEVNARGNDFTFLVNHEVIYEMTDDREPRGGLALYVEVNKETPMTISFDNFGLQPR